MTPLFLKLKIMPRSAIRDFNYLSRRVRKIGGCALKLMMGNGFLLQVDGIFMFSGPTDIVELSVKSQLCASYLSFFGRSTLLRCRMPSDWSELFNANSALYSFKKSHGYLLVL